MPLYFKLKRNHVWHKINSHKKNKKTPVESEFSTLVKTTANTVSKVFPFTSIRALSWVSNLSSNRSETPEETQCGEVMMCIFCVTWTSKKPKEEK
jgi:hypothetical protein